MKQNLKYKSIIILLVFLVLSCNKVENPIKVEVNSTNQKAIVLCEGLWGYDNATIDLIDLDSNIVIKNYYKSINGYKLGDTGTDIQLFAGNYFVTVTSSHSIEKIDSAGFLSLGRLKLDVNSEPRYIAICNNNEAYFTDLKQNKLVKFNPSTLQIIGELQVGAAPEGLDYNSDYIFVANSGLGDYKKNEPLAGYLSIISRNQFESVSTIYIGPNPYQVIYNKLSNKVYVSYRNYPSEPDSLGGLVEINTNTMKIERSWKLKITKFIICNELNQILLVNDFGLTSIDLATGIEKSLLLKLNKDNFYGLSYKSPDQIWICNAKNYTVDGEIFCFNLKQNKIVSRFDLSINPNNILFK